MSPKKMENIGCQVPKDTAAKFYKKCDELSVDKKAIFTALVTKFSSLPTTHEAEQFLQQIGMAKKSVWTA